ncbi:MAG: site-specific integrase [Lachnospiraceae bacterium]|nr:site-specific integrase [Lachnospiraceae bacterium]
MGKDLKGHNLGKGLSQRKDTGKYQANYYNSDGRRISREFATLTEARTWLADSKYEDAHHMTVVSEKMTVNEWFDAWSREKAVLVRPNTMRNYRERFENDIKPVIGRMRIVDVKPIHCQEVLNRMVDIDDPYAYGTVRQTLNTMTTLFWAAYENDIIRKSPVTKIGVKMPVTEKKEIDFFSIEEERRFIEVARNYCYYEQYRLILELGLRTSELVGLTWKCVDLKNREICIEKTLEYRYSTKEWAWGPPKTKQGFRTLKLTNKSYEILADLWNKRKVNEKTPDEFKDIVFLNRTGYPTKNSTYDSTLEKRCKKAEIKKLSMHDLRHTMATRFVEQSTDYKRLSKMLGHSSIKVTVDTYVHETNETVEETTAKFSNYLDSLFD